MNTTPKFVYAVVVLGINDERSWIQLFRAGEPFTPMVTAAKEDIETIIERCAGHPPHVEVIKPSLPVVIEDWEAMRDWITERVGTDN